MKNYHLFRTSLLLSLLFLLVAAPLPAATLLGPGDLIYGIDLDVGAPPSSPGAEGVANVLDGDSGTKYLLFGGNWSGLIVTPGSSTVQSMRFTTANDATDRDPAYYRLYGTTDPITSAAYGRGRSENWTLISGGPVSLPDARFDASTVVSFGNSAVYTSYKLVFPNIRQGAQDLMQIADVQFYPEAAGGGTALLAPGQPIVPVDDTGREGSSQYPAGESPARLLDGNHDTKYLNFGELNSGFIIAPQLGRTVVTGLEVWTANDFSERDPVGFSLYGHIGGLDYGDNSTGDMETWALISSGVLGLPEDRFASGGIAAFANETAYDAYRFVVTSVKNEAAANCLQFSDIQFYGYIPEPSTLSLLGLGAAALILLRGRRP